MSRYREERRKSGLDPARPPTVPELGGGREADAPASGAVAGIDGLLAARTAGLRSVTYTSLKEAKAWIGTPAQALLSAIASVRRTHGGAS